MVQEGNGKGNEDSSTEKRVGKVKKTPPVNVRVIENQQGVALIEWIEDKKIRRAMLPIGEVESGTVAADVLERALPYGHEWENENFPSVDPEALANELRREGIWTQEDLLDKTHLARAAIQRAYINPLLKQLIDKTIEQV